MINQQLQYDFIVALNRYIKKANNSSYSPIVGITAKEDGELQLIITHNWSHYVSRNIKSIVDFGYRNTNMRFKTGRHSTKMQKVCEGLMGNVELKNPSYNCAKCNCLGKRCETCPVNGGYDCTQCRWEGNNTCTSLLNNKEVGTPVYSLTEFWYKDIKGGYRTGYQDIRIKMPSKLALVNLMNNLIIETSRTK